MSHNNSYTSPYENINQLGYLMQMPDQSTMIGCRVCNEVFQDSVHLVNHFESHLHIGRTSPTRFYERRSPGLNQNLMVRSLAPYPSSFTPLIPYQTPTTQSEQWQSRGRNSMRRASSANPYQLSSRFSSSSSGYVLHPPMTESPDFHQPSTRRFIPRPEPEPEPEPEPVRGPFAQVPKLDVATIGRPYGYTMQYIEQLERPINEGNVIDDGDDDSNEIDFTLRL